MDSGSVPAEATGILPDVLGTAGGLLIVAAYFLLQIGRLDPRSLAYSAVNAIGAALILFSLWFDFNLGPHGTQIALDEYALPFEHDRQDENHLKL